MIEKFINTKKLTDDEKSYLEQFYKNALNEEKNKKIAQIKLINEAKDVVRLRELKEEETQKIDTDKIKINNILIEITDKEIKDSNVEFSKKIREAMGDNYIKDLMVCNKDFLYLLENSNIEEDYITIYANYED
jgi:hypothetical protein